MAGLPGRRSIVGVVPPLSRGTPGNSLGFMNGRSPGPPEPRQLLPESRLYPREVMLFEPSQLPSGEALKKILLLTTREPFDVHMLFPCSVHPAPVQPTVSLLNVQKSKLVVFVAPPLEMEP